MQVRWPWHPVPELVGTHLTPPAPSPLGEQCPRDPSTMLQRVWGAQLGEMLPDTHSGALSHLFLLLI